MKQLSFYTGRAVFRVEQEDDLPDSEISQVMSLVRGKGAEHIKDFGKALKEDLLPIL